jgi:ribokinase
VVIVFGSINIDLVTRAPRIPGPGETALGRDYVVNPGGKGANQALAARRAGASVAMVGAYGSDSFANDALALLRADGVDLSASRRVDRPTGAAFIVVDDDGENAIVVASGANLAARAEQLHDLTIAPGDILLLQRETPDAETEAAAFKAKARGAKVMLNLAPAGPISGALIGALDYLCVNEHEAASLAETLGLAPRDPAAICREVCQRYGVTAIATLGAAGAVGFRREGPFAAPAPDVKVVDSTAAGDTFVGAFAAALDRGLDFETALRRGLAAGSLACTRAGAQPSMPYAAEIEALAGR